MFKKLAVLFFMVFLLSQTVYGATITEAVGEENIKNAEEVIEEKTGLSFKSVADSVLNGNFEFSLGGVLEKCADIFFSEIKDCVLMLKPLFVAVIMSAVLKNLSSSFNSKAVAEMGLYVCYMVMVFVVMDMFRVAGGVAIETLIGIRDITAASMPIFYTFMAATGEVGGAYVMGPFVAGAASVMAEIGQRVILPAISLGVGIEIVNNLTEREYLGKMSELIRKGVGWVLKIGSGGFMAILSLQKIGTSAGDLFAGRFFKAAAGAVPVVGDVMSGAFETAAALLTAAKSSSLAAVIVAAAVLCAIPIIKVFAIMGIFKAMSVVLEPVAEKRFIKALSAVGDYTGILIGTIFAAMVMFLFAAMILL